jgi:hypothetical protein
MDFVVQFVWQPAVPGLPTQPAPPPPGQQPY